MHRNLLDKPNAQTSVKTPPTSSSPHIQSRPSKAWRKCCMRACRAMTTGLLNSPYNFQGVRDNLCGSTRDSADNEVDFMTVSLTCGGGEGLSDLRVEGFPYKEDSSYSKEKSALLQQKLRALTSIWDCAEECDGKTTVKISQSSQRPRVRHWLVVNAPKNGKQLGLRSRMLGFDCHPDTNQLKRVCEWKY